MSIDKGTLYVVATPIGNLGDLSPRAKQVLQEVALIAAEDTRHSRKLLSAMGISTAMCSLHQHNESGQTPKLLEKLLAGASIALISDAGTPLISDPGFELVKAARQAGVQVSPVPGPSAMIAALSTSGLPADHFSFCGFLPAKRPARLRRLEELSRRRETLIFYESVHRLEAAIVDLSEVFGPDRDVCLARELTKVHETIVSASLGDLADLLNQNSDMTRGEAVIIVAGDTTAEKQVENQASERILRILLSQLPLKQAAQLAAQIGGGNKNALYQLALEINREEQ